MIHIQCIFWPLRQVERSESPSAWVGTFDYLRRDAGYSAWTSLIATIRQPGSRVPVVWNPVKLFDSSQIRKMKSRYEALNFLPEGPVSYKNGSGWSRLSGYLSTINSNPFDMLLNLVALATMAALGHAQQTISSDSGIVYNCPTRSTIEAAYQDYCES